MNSASTLATGISRARECGASPSTSSGSSWRNSSPCSSHDAVSTGFGPGGPIQITVRRAPGAKRPVVDISTTSWRIETISTPERPRSRADRARRARIDGDPTDDSALEANALVAGTDGYAGYCGQHHGYCQRSGRAVYGDHRRLRNDGAINVTIPRPSILGQEIAAHLFRVQHFRTQ